MAYRKSKGKLARRSKKKNEPAVLNMSFRMPGTGTNYIDLSQCASVLNRRFYRQGINWAVAGFTATVTGTFAGIGSITVCKAPTTWVTYQAWKKSKIMWDKMNDQILDEGESLKPRFHDYKIYLDEDHVTSTLQASVTSPATDQQQIPTDCGYSTPTMGEWQYSTLTMPNAATSGNTEEFKIKLLGDSDNGTGAANQSKAIIQGYAMSRARPQPFDPNVPDATTVPEENWMQNLFDDGEQLDELRDNLQDENDAPPYPVGTPGSQIEYYPGSENQLSKPEVVGYAVLNSPAGATGGVAAQRSIKGGMFPCGLIKVTSAIGISAYDLIVHLVPGPHRGYMCEPMEDV